MIISDMFSVKPDFKREVIDVPEFGEDAQMVLQEFSAAQASDFNESIISAKRDVSTTAPGKRPLRELLLFYCTLICCSAVNEKGERIAKLEDAEKLLEQWDQNLILRIGAVAAKLNGFDGKAVDETKKDLPESQPQES